MKPRIRRRLLLVAAALLALALSAPWLVRQGLWRRELNPVLRGRRTAEEVGCFNCHRPWGEEIPNPGSRWGSVPRFGGGNAMMYAESRQAIGEFIRFGAPREWLDNPNVQKRLDAQRIRMPAFGGRLSEREIADLTAWAAAVEGVAPPGGDAAAPGRALAGQHGCTACHGIEGAGGRPNPGSLGGFIPGFAGGNFRDLVRDEAEFREWVRTGRSRRLEANPVVRGFWRRQAISMPAFGDALSDADLGALWAWVQAVQGSEAAGPPSG